MIAAEVSAVGVVVFAGHIFVDDLVDAVLHWVVFVGFIVTAWSRKRPVILLMLLRDSRSGWMSVVRVGRMAVDLAVWGSVRRRSCPVR